MTWTADKNVELPILKNPGSANDVPAFCIHDFVNEKVILKKKKLAYVCERNGVTRKWTWDKLKHDIDSFGKACIAMGV